MALKQPCPTARFPLGALLALSIAAAGRIGADLLHVFGDLLLFLLQLLDPVLNVFEEPSLSVSLTTPASM